MLWISIPAPFPVFLGFALFSPDNGAFSWRPVVLLLSEYLSGEWRGHNLYPWEPLIIIYLHKSILSSMEEAGHLCWTVGHFLITLSHKISDVMGRGETLVARGCLAGLTVESSKADHLGLSFYTRVHLLSELFWPSCLLGSEAQRKAGMTQMLSIQ